MTVMRQSSSEGRTIVEGELGFALRQLELFLEGVDLRPICKDFLFLSWEVRLVGY